MWDPYVESLLDNVIVKRRVPMEAVDSISLEVSPSNTHGTNCKKHSKEWKIIVTSIQKSIVEDEIRKF